MVIMKGERKGCSRLLENFPLKSLKEGHIWRWWWKGMEDFESITYKYYRGEMKDYLFYSKLAEIEKDEELRESLRKLSAMEREHARFFLSMLRNKREAVPRFSVHISLLLRRLLGLSITLKILERGEKRAIESYIRMLEGNMVPEEYRERLRAIIVDEIYHEDFFEHREELVARRTEKIRDAVYGMSDGLVEVLASVAGLVPVLIVPLYVAIGGLVVGISGSLSMAIGAYLSVKAEKDYRESRVRIETLKSRVTGEVMEEEKKVYSNPLSSAINTGLFYILGAIFPILPFLFLGGNLAVVLSFILVVTAQSITSIMISILSDTPILKSLLRTVSLTVFAALSTYLIGNVIHSVLGISI
ncbi:MAG TPA: rubrerythrin family protein [Euryarchaeota archaeon]|nr:rubrerythrin family protein [Euryarchaeota archaeon]